MSRNLYKASWVVVSGDEKHVIDSNALVEKRIEEQAALRRASSNMELEQGEEAGFVSGLGGEAIDALLRDNSDDSGIIKAEKAPDLEEIKAQAQEMLDDAQAQIDEMNAAAQNEIEAKRRWAMEEGKKEGYEEGYRKGVSEAEEMKRQVMAERRRLEAEYEQLIDELEPRFIDTITEVYSHIFGIGLADNRDILVHLVDSTLRQVESSRTFIVHVSKEDYPFVNMQKQALTEGAAAGRGTVEIIEDLTLGRGECMIETDGGIFDCGVDTQLTELNNKLRMLSYERS
ncbi:MAG: hypothetical protein K1W10_14920 [Lachnospiraceae bacterium]